jgi:hypothetical protein
MTSPTGLVKHLGDRNHAGAWRVAVEALENFVDVLPGFDQRGCECGVDAQIAGDAPLALEGPIDDRILVHLQRHDAPTFLGREDFLGLIPWQIDHRARTHRESIPFVHCDPEWFIAAAIAAVENRAQVRNRHVEHANRRLPTANHPAAAANNVVFEDRDQVVERGRGRRGASEMRQHRGGGDAGRCAPGHRDFCRRETLRRVTVLRRVDARRGLLIFSASTRSRANILRASAGELSWSYPSRCKNP